MKLLTTMNRIKELDHEVASVQKVDITFDTLCKLFATTKKQSNFMILYLRKCEKEGYTLTEAQYMLEGYMLNTIEVGNEVKDMTSGDSGIVTSIYIYKKNIWVSAGESYYKLDDVELIK